MSAAKGVTVFVTDGARFLGPFEVEHGDAQVERAKLDLQATGAANTYVVAADCLSQARRIWNRLREHYNFGAIPEPDFSGVPQAD